ncbi:polymorphic outer membrane protein middle domain-containing protein [Chlamydia vaughanii]|uniref:polymorphic outer membrane protein middle domain-containing protein n=1 Tax=Chlamydia vaughanii TaxID=3112552 RepID=UPI0032B25947
MKWLSATAVFAAVLPSITVFSEPVSKELNVNLKGSGISTNDANMSNFTQVTGDASGTLYNLQGSVTFSTFTNIPIPKPQPEVQPPAKDSTSKPAAAYRAILQNLYSSSLPTYFSRIGREDFDFGLFLALRNSYSPFFPQSSSTTGTAVPVVPPVPKGGGAFYNDQGGPLGFTTDPGKPGSLSCSLIKMTGKGGAIYSTGPVSFEGLENLTFLDNLSQEAGGAIFSDSTVTISNILEQIEFSRNIARVPVPMIPLEPSAPAGPSQGTGGSGGGGTGGGGGNGSSSGGPSSSGTGGAVPTQKVIYYAASSGDAGSQVALPTYTTETAGNGGAIFAKGAIAISKYKDMTFRSNIADFPSIIDTILANAAQPPASAPAQPAVDPAVIKGSGGAIFGLDTITISEGSNNTLFILNTATGSGGAIYSEKDVTLDTISSLKFQSNGSDATGGAIYSKGNTVLQNSDQLVQFSANYGKTGGGAIYASGNVTISDLAIVSFGANKAGNYDLNPGQVVPPKQQDAGKVVSSIISASGAADANAQQQPPAPVPPPLGKGGGVYAEGTFTVSNIISSLDFANNQATDHGGGVYSKGAFSCSNSHRVQFTKNISKKSGGGLYCEADVTLSNLTGQTLFQGNTAVEDGGGICLAATKSLTATNLANFCLDSNISSKSGGGASIPSALTVTFNNTPAPGEPAPVVLPVSGKAVITKNTATEHGGGVYTTTATFTNLEAISVDSNTAQKNGGGLCTQNIPAAGAVVGGAAAANDEDFKVDYVIATGVTKNTASESGGGVYGKKGKLSRVNELDISENSAGKFGGGLYFTESLSLEEISVANLTGNSAKEAGGALHAKTLTWNGCPQGISFSNNKAETNSTAAAGGAVAPTAITGGALYAETLTLQNIKTGCTFAGNKASDTNAAASGANPPADPNIQGGAIYAKTSFTLENSEGITFTGNSAVTQKTSTTGQVAGGAIYSPAVTIQNCSQTITFSENTALCTPAAGAAAAAAGAKDTFGGAIAATTSITFTGNQMLSFKRNSADVGAAIGCKNDTAGNDGAITFSDFSQYLFEENVAKNRGAIFANTLSAPQGNIRFENNSSTNDGSAIYFTKQVDITSAGAVLFLDNKVLAAQTRAAGQAAAVRNLGAAIYGDPSANDAILNLTALGGNITFKNNQVVPTAPAATPTSFCSVTGKVKLTLNAAANQSINFYDAVNVSTTKTADFDPLDINKPVTGNTPQQYKGTVLFSGELHENKSFIPQKAVLHDGTLVLGKNAELNVVSFEQKPGSLLVMGPGSVLATYRPQSAAKTEGIAINNLTIDFSEMVTEDGTMAPPSLQLKTTGAPARARAQKNDSSLPQANKAAPSVDQEKIFLTGTITLVDPLGAFYQNPFLGQDREIELLKLPTDAGKVDISDLSLQGDTQPQKGYIGSWTLNPVDQNGKIQASWKFEEYRRWIYIPRDNYFYVNSILGSQNSLVAVKQGIVNNMLNNARFDDAAYNNLWLSGIASFVSNDKGEDGREFTYHARGYSLAIDAKPRPDFILGASFSQVFGHSKSEKSVHNYKHKGSDHSFQGTLYTGKAFYMPYRRSQAPRPVLFQGVITYGYMKHDTTTYYPSIHERNLGNWEDLGWLFDMRLTLDLKEPSQRSTARFSFYSELEYTGVRQKQFTEIDYDPRSFGSLAYRNLAIPLGFVFEGALMQYDVLMYNKLSLAYVPVIYRNKPICHCKVVSTGKKSIIAGTIPTRNTSRGEYSTQVYLGPYWTLYGTYTIDAGMYSLAQMVNCGARMIF